MSNFELFDGDKGSSDSFVSRNDPLAGFLAKSKLKHGEQISFKELGIPEPSVDGIGFSSLPSLDKGYFGLPNAFSRGCLFSARKNAKDVEYQSHKEILSEKNTRLTYSGLELRQTDLDVFISILATCSSGNQMDLRKPFVLRARSLLTMLNLQDGKGAYERLAASIARLDTANIWLTQTFADSDGRLISNEYKAGRLVQVLASTEVSKGSLRARAWIVQIDPSFARTYAKDSCTISLLEYRNKLDGRALLAKWLLQYYFTHREPIGENINSLAQKADLSLQNNTLKKNFTKACQDLVDIGFIESFWFVGNNLHVERTALKRIKPLSEAFYDGKSIEEQLSLGI